MVWSTFRITHNTDETITKVVPFPLIVDKTKIVEYLLQNLTEQVGYRLKFTCTKIWWIAERIWNSNDSKSGIWRSNRLHTCARAHTRVAQATNWAIWTLLSWNSVTQMINWYTNRIIYVIFWNLSIYRFSFVLNVKSFLLLN